MVTSLSSYVSGRVHSMFVAYNEDALTSRDTPHVETGLKS